MTYIRGLLVLFLSAFCLVALLYYTILPQGPLLFRSSSASLNPSSASEIMIRADKFTPE